MTATASATVLIFAKGQDPVIVEEGENKYATGKLTNVGIHSVSWHVTQIKKYLKSSWGYDQDKDDEASVEASSAGRFLLSNEAIVVLASDYTSELKPADLLKWPPEFFDKCFQAALALNPKLLAPAAK